MPVTFSLLAGNPNVAPVATDGIGLSARFLDLNLGGSNNRLSPGVDSSGNIYLMDGFALRKVTQSGRVTTIAGSSTTQGYTDGTGSAARFFNVSNIAIDSDGNMYATERSNFTIRKITPLGVVTTFAGTSGAAGTTDGTGAAARFTDPLAIIYANDGNLYVLDQYAIRKVTTAAVVTTFAGNITASGTTDGTGTAARFNIPVGFAQSPIDNAIYTLEFNAGLTAKILRKCTLAAVVTSPANSGVTISIAVLGLSCDSSGNFYTSRFVPPSPKNYYIITSALAATEETPLGLDDYNMRTKIVPGSLFVGAVNVSAPSGQVILTSAVVSTNYSGLYRVTTPSSPGLHDTYVDSSTGATDNSKIPNPSFKTGFING